MKENHNNESISLLDVVKIYEKLDEKNKLKPNGAGVKRMKYLQTMYRLGFKSFRNTRV